MIFRHIARAVTWLGIVTQIVALLLMQWLLQAGKSGATGPAHAPLDSCAAAGCACCASHPQGQSCCCTPESHAAIPASESVWGKMLTQLIRAEQCRGATADSATVAIAKCEIVLPAQTGSDLPARLTLPLRSVQQTPELRTYAPPVPPPRSLARA